MEILHVLWQFTTEFVDAGHQRLEVVAVFNTSSFRYLLDRLPLQSNQIDPEDGVVVVSRKLRGSVLD